jgi:hypothetical protein
MKAPCPPPCKDSSCQLLFCLSMMMIRFHSIEYVAEPTPKKEVKACFQCKGADACQPDKLDGSEIRTSGAFGGSNLYCYTVRQRQCLFSHHLSMFIFNRNSILRQALLLLVAVSALVNHWIRILNVMLSTIFAVMKIYATSKQLVSVRNKTMFSNKANIFDFMKI